MPWQRIVSHFPLERIWSAGGLEPHARLRELTAPEMPAKLAEYPEAQLVVANFRSDLRWYAPSDFGFWEHFAHAHVRGNGDAQTPPFYAASLWIDRRCGKYAILFEEDRETNNSPDSAPMISSAETGFPTP